MGANFKDFGYADSSDPLAIFMYIVFGLLAIFIGYKTFLYYREQRQWSWYTQMCKEKRMSVKEVAFLKNIVVRKKITSVDDLYGSIFSLNLPSPIKRKLLWDDEPSGARARKPTRVQR